MCDTQRDELLTDTVRTWIRQEVFASRDLVLQCGRQCVPFHDFSSYMQQYLNAVRPLPRMVPKCVELLIRDYEQGRMIQDDRPGISVSSPKGWRALPSKGNRRISPPPAEPESTNFLLTFMSVLGNGIEFDVSDDRDRVYGLLGPLLQHPAVQNSIASPSNVSSVI